MIQIYNLLETIRIVILFWHSICISYEKTI